MRHAQRHDVAARLLQASADRARALGAAGESIIVADANTGARRLYERSGFVETARAPMVKEGWVNDSTEWVLMLKTR